MGAGRARPLLYPPHPFGKRRIYDGNILSGSGVYSTGKVSVRLSAGDTFILFPGTELQYQADSEEPWEYCWAGFMGADAASIIRNTDFSRDMPYIPGGRIPEEEIRDGMEQIYLSKGNTFSRDMPYIPGGRIPEEEIRDGMEQIYLSKGNTYESAVAMAGKLYSLLAVFMHYAEKPEPEKDAHVTYVEKALTYIETNYSYPVTVEDIAYYVGISRSHLFREYLTEYRIKQACHLLRETDLSVSAIAYSVGFENNLYFSKAFRKQKGLSPSEYRKEKAKMTGEKND